MTIVSSTKTAKKSVSLSLSFSNPAQESGYKPEPRLPVQSDLMNSLVQYPNLTLALAELIDNSGEYRETSKGKIKVYIEEDRIIVSDDGIALNKNSMRDMFQIKQQSHKFGETGRFGYGFKAGTHYIAKQVRVVSWKDNTFVYGQMHDSTTEWDYPVTTLSKNSGQNYNECVKAWDAYGVTSRRRNTGTIVILEGLKAKPPQGKDLEKFKKQLGYIYYDIFSNRKEIGLYVNEQKVKYVNPLASSIKVKGKFGQKLNFGWDRQPKVYVDESGNKHHLIITTSVLPEGAGRDYAGFCVSRVGRLVTHGCSWRYTHIMGDQASMRRFQIMIECGTDMDDFFRMGANKTIDRHQTLNDHFFTWLKHPKTGLRAIVEQQYGTNSTPKKKDLSGWMPTLTYLARLSNSNEEMVSQLELVEDKTRQKPIKKISEKKTPKTTGSHPGANKLSKGLDRYRGTANLTLRPLGVEGPVYEIEYEMVGSGQKKEQTILVFNEDIGYVKDLIDITQSGEPLLVAKKFVSAMWAEVMAIKAGLLTDEEVDFLNKINRKLHSKRYEYGAGAKRLNFMKQKQVA